MGSVFLSASNSLLICQPSVSRIQCGAGRDTKYFLSRGYQVDAVDGSEQLCRIASEYTEIKVRQMLFQELDEKEKYDGIWACASILHLPKKQLREVLKKVRSANLVQLTL